MDGATDPEADARARLERDYLAGALSADDYTRLRRQLEEGGTASTAPARTDFRYASWGRRAGALLLDWLVLSTLVYAVLILDVLTANALTEDYVGIVILAAPPLYAWLMVGRFGQTLGKMIVGVRVVRAEDEGRVGYARAAARAGSVAALGLLLLPLVIAWLWPLWDERNQTLYDKMVDTIVVRVR